MHYYWYIEWESRDKSEGGRSWYPNRTLAKQALASYHATGCTATLHSVLPRVRKDSRKRRA